MKIEPGQFWTVMVDGNLEYVVTVMPLEDGGWACVPISKDIEFACEYDVFLPPEYLPQSTHSMIMAWMNTYLEDDQLIDSFGFLDPDVFGLVKRIWHFQPIPEYKRSWIGRKWSLDAPGLEDYRVFQKRQIHRWNEVSQRVMDRMFAFDEEVDPEDSTHPTG